MTKIIKRLNPKPAPFLSKDQLVTFKLWVFIISFFFLVLTFMFYFNDSRLTGF